MKWMITILAGFALFCGSLTAGEGKGEDSAMKKLKKILKKMETVEQLLAKSHLSESEKKQAEIIKELKEKVASGKLKEDEVIDEIDKQLKVVVKKMKDIDMDIEKLIQSVKMSQSQGGGDAMEFKDNQSKPGQGKKRKDKSGRDLKKMREEDKKPKEGEGKKKDGGKKGGDDPAKKAYEAKGKGPDGAAPRAAGTGRWGSLPLKEFKEALASGKVTVPEKYRALIEKYLAMLAEEDKEKKD